MSTTTSENHIYGYSGFTAGDDMANIGYFEAVLSLSGTSHLWTVPTFTNDNLRHEPTFDSQWKTWTPTASASGSLTYTSVTVNHAKYKVVPYGVKYKVRTSGTLGGSASNTLFLTKPFLATLAADNPLSGYGQTAGVAASVYISASDLIGALIYDGSNYATSGNCAINIQVEYEI